MQGSENTFLHKSHRFLFALLLLHGSSCAQPPLIENSKLNDSALRDTVRRASYASGLPVIHPLSMTLVDRSELFEILRQDLDAVQKTESWATRQAGYHSMGFLSGDWQDAYSSIALLSRSATGLYIKDKKTLYLVREPARSGTGSFYLDAFGDLGHQVTLAHEVIHALQHQHYPEVFELREHLWQQQADANISLHAAIEGDATLWAAQSIGFYGGARDPEEVLAFSRDSQFEPFSDSPPLVRERVIFPYTYGYRFAYQLGKQGLKSPPASTEQVIHIKDREGSPFTAIDLSDFAVYLSSKGCRIAFQDTMGELTLSLWLRSLDSHAAQQAWDGWDGDRWIAVECPHSREIAWLTSWDTDRDAGEFENAFRVIAADWQRRAELRSPLVAERREREVIVTSGGLQPEIVQMKRLARQARVTTRAELATHFSNTKSHSIH